jgi:hypothetical protein
LDESSADGDAVIMYCRRLPFSEAEDGNFTLAAHVYNVSLVSLIGKMNIRIDWQFPSVHSQDAFPERIRGWLIR